MDRTARMFSSFEEQESESYRYWQTLPLRERMHATWSLSHRDAPKGDPMLPLTANYKDMLDLFAAHEVRYLIVGGYAYSIYARARFTGDIDLFVSPDPENAERVYRAVAEFGGPLHGTDAAYFSRPDVVFQLGVEPDRIDILTGITGVSFERAWSTRVVDGTYSFISREALIENKSATGREQDLVDVKNLKRGQA
jgi:hypothetical protein